MSSRRAFILIAALVSVAACSSESNNNNNSTKDTGTSGGDTGVKDTATEDTAPKVCGEAEVPAMCETPMGGAPAGSQCVRAVTGNVKDTAGAPVGCKLVSICGKECYFGETRDDGTFTGKIGTFIKVADFAASVHGRPHHASLYEKVPTGTADLIALPTTLVLPMFNMTGTKIPIVKVGTKRLVQTAIDITDGDVTLKFAADTEVELDLDDMAMVDEGLPGDHLRTVKVAPAQYPTFAKDANIKVLYAASPFDMKYINKKVPLEIKDTGGIAEGTAVEIIALGNEFLEEPFTAGKLQVVANGKITGGKVVTDAGEGLSYLTWIGVRPK
jgi:hypothetical protein